MLSATSIRNSITRRVASPSLIAVRQSSALIMAPKRAAPASPTASGSRKSLRSSSSQAKAAPEDAEDALEEQLPEIDDALLLAAAEEAERRASVPRSSQPEAQEKAKPEKPAAGLLADDADPLAMERRTMHPEWFARLEKSMAAPSFKQLKSFLTSEAKAGTTVYPPPELVHSWSRLTPPSNVKIVILGQDPYHGPGQACGTSFSVPRSVPAPPSLKNMYKELRAEYGNDFAVPTHGCLDGWAKQGVLLLNACLTVRAGAAASHHGKGWEPFTRAVLQAVAAEAARAGPGAASGAKPAAAAPPKGQGTITGMFAKQKKQQSSDKGPQAAEEAPASAPAADAAPSAPQGAGEKQGGVVFLAWGLPAAKSLADAGITDASPNVLVLKSAHPSPLSAHRGFFRAAATPKLPSLFKQANDWLEQPGRRGSGGGVRWGEL